MNVLINVLLLGDTIPDVTIQSRIYKVLLTWNHTVRDCYRDIVFTYRITHCFANGTFCRFNTTENKEYTISELEPSTNHFVTVTAFSKENPDIYSNSVNVDTATLGM